MLVTVILIRSQIFLHLNTIINITCPLVTRLILLSPIKITQELGNTSYQAFGKNIDFLNYIYPIVYSWIKKINHIIRLLSWMTISRISNPQRRTAKLQKQPKSFFIMKTQKKSMKSTKKYFTILFYYLNRSKNTKEKKKTS